MSNQIGPKGAEVKELQRKAVPARKQPAESKPAPAQEQAPAEPEERVNIGLVVNESTKDIGMGPLDANGDRETTHTLLWVDESKAERLKKEEGAFEPNLQKIITDADLGERGRLELIGVKGADNPNAENIVRIMEVPDEVRQINPKTGKAPIEDMEARMVPKDSEILPQRHYAKLEDGGSGKIWGGVKTGLDQVVDRGSNLVNQSMAGLFFNIPYANLLGIGMGAWGSSRTLEDLREVGSQIHEMKVLQAEAGDNDVVNKALPDGTTVAVSAENTLKRLAAQELAGKVKLGGNVALIAAGVAGTVTGGAAFVPMLAASGMVLGNGAAGLQALKDLKELGAEKQKLLELQAAGQTHIKKTLEGPGDKGVMEAVKVVEQPIDMRLGEIEDEKKGKITQATMIGGISAGTMASLGFNIVGIGAGFGLGVAPVAAYMGVNAGIDLFGKDLPEKKELQAAQDAGETKVARTKQLMTGEYKEINVSIEEELKQLQKKIDGKKVILTGTATALATIGATVGAGMTAWIMAPAALAVAAVAATLFPDEAKAIAENVWGKIKGIFSKDARSLRAAKKAVKKLVEGFAKSTKARDKLKVLDGRKAELEQAKQSGQTTFKKKVTETGADGKPIEKEIDVPIDGELAQIEGQRREALATINAESRLKAADEDMFKYLEPNVKKYAGATSPQGRERALGQIDIVLQHLNQKDPEHTRAWFKAFQELNKDVTQVWLDHEIGVHMRDEVTRAMFKNPNLSGLLEQRGLAMADAEQAYENGVRLEQDPQKFQELQMRANQGDQTALNDLEIMGVFKAARLLADAEKNFGEKWLEDFYIDVQGGNGKFSPKMVEFHTGKAQEATNAKHPERLVGYDEDGEVYTKPPEVKAQAIAQLAQAAALLLGVDISNMASPQQMAQSDSQPQQSTTPAGPEPKVTFKWEKGPDGKLVRKAVTPEEQPAAAQPAPVKTVGAAATPDAEPLLLTDEMRIDAPPVNQQQPSPAESRMAQAFAQLHKADAAAAVQLDKAMGALMGEFETQPKSAEELQAMRQQASKELDAALTVLEEKAPDALKVWDQARKEVDNQKLEASIDKELMNAVLDSPAVKGVAEEVGYNDEQVSGLYKMLHRAVSTDNYSEIGPIMNATDPESAKGKDKAVITVLNNVQAALAQQAVAGQADSETIEARREAFLELVHQQNPFLETILEGDAVKGLAEQAQVEPKFVKDAFYSLALAEVDPQVAARLNVGHQNQDPAVLKEIQVGQMAHQLVQQETARAVQADAAANPEKYDALVDQQMQDPFIKTLLGMQELNEAANAEGVDLKAMVRLGVEARVKGDVSKLVEVNQKAQQQDIEAVKKVKILGMVDQATASLQRQMAQQGRPPAA